MSVSAGAYQAALKKIVICEKTPNAATRYGMLKNVRKLLMIRPPRDLLPLVIPLLSGIRCLRYDHRHGRPLAGH